MPSSSRPQFLLLLPWLALGACTPRPAVAPPTLSSTPSPPAPPATAAGDKAEKPKWDVEHPPGPTREATLDVDQGTWLSLDVSPDGKEIAFDLLGDVYVIPATGGEARAVTTGIAWDIQPRFSPDGQWIAFTSDRDGAENVWIVRRDGTDARQVTKEDFRVVNSPVWTPDSQYVAVRKHFTATRSIGAGEIWLYHRGGGKGVQMVERDNDQKDLGEPAFAPDGRYLYFSQDTTPGATFEYNKNPHDQIYVIKRVDLRDQRTEVFVDGPGGAVTPTPSPDGKLLAFVRRVGPETVLFVHDVASGANRALYRGLDRDMQETWAVHGVYPTMAFFPDAKAIAVWAGGKIHRIDVATGADQIVPFRVRGKRTMSEALRATVEVQPARFPTRMLRWVQVAPDGASVVFQALGHLWVYRFADKTHRRITSDDAFEFHPSISRDGKSVVYTTWSDDALGAVRVAPLRGGKSRVVTETPGHYVEPAFSPDGETIVFRRVDGGGLRPRTWSRDTGLWAIPSKGGKARLVSRNGRDPHFGADGERVYYTQSSGTPSVGRSTSSLRYQLKSVDLDGSDDRVHLDSAGATDFRVSPDGRWIAFRERFNAFIAPFPPVGKTFEVGPKMESLPVVRVSKDAGEYLHWSGDGKRLHWALGPQLFTRTLEDSFAFMPGAPKELPTPAAEGVDIAMQVASDLPSGRIALVGAKIVTMKGDEVVADGVVVIDGNRIAAVGPRASVPIPTDAKVFDVAGHTVIPGIVDVHAHGPQGSDGITPQQSWLHLNELAFGVTTIHDPSNDTDTIFAAAELARTGATVSPRIYSTGTILYGAETPARAVIDDLEDAKTHIRRMKAVGAFSVKSYSQPRRNQRQQLVAAAREYGMLVVTEGRSFFHHNMNMVIDGHTGVEHNLPVGRIYEDVIQLWSQSQVGLTPTLIVAYGGLQGESYWYQHTPVHRHPRVRTFVPPEEYEPKARRRVMADDDDWNYVAVARACKQLADRGVGIQLGAHGQREGLGAHWELWMFVQGGMTPHQALRTATLAGARYLGLDRDLGSIEPGKLADLAVIRGDPLADIRSSEHVRYTVINGRIFDSATMDQLGNHPRKRARLWWE